MVSTENKHGYVHTVNLNKICYPIEIESLNSKNILNLIFIFWVVFLNATKTKCGYVCEIQGAYLFTTDNITPSVTIDLV